MALSARGVSLQKRPFIYLKARSLRIARAPHPSLAATTTFKHGCEQFQTTETSRKCSFLAGRGHRNLESHQGCLWYTTSPGSIWFRQYSSNNDQGTLSTLLR